MSVTATEQIYELPVLPTVPLQTIQSAPRTEDITQIGPTTNPPVVEARNNVVLAGKSKRLAITTFIITANLVQVKSSDQLLPYSTLIRDVLDDFKHCIHSRRSCDQQSSRS